MATGFPGAPPPPSDNKEVPGWLRRMFIVFQQIHQGKLNAVGSVTLAASATTTAITDPRINSESFIGLMPKTSNAAGALSGLYVTSRGDGTATLAHASTTTTDRGFDFCIIG